jgi:YD repeat-containing protein
MTKPLVLSAIVAMLSATAAQATEAAISCQEAGSLKGPIADIVVTMGRYRHSTGQPEGGVSVEQDLHFSEARRTLTIATHEMDVPGHPFPRTICEFDSAGTVVKDVLLLDGSNPFTTVAFEYDGEGRLAKSTSTSENPRN